MKVRHALYGAALVVATAAITTQVISQDKKDAGMPQMTPEQQAFMQKCMEFGTPGESHKLLAKKIGKWNDEVIWWMEPGTEPMKSAGTTEYKSIWDGRYLVDTTEGEGMGDGHTFHGMGTSGYDNMKKKFFWTWIDSEGTGVIVGEGNYDAATKTFTYTFDAPNIHAGKYTKSRSIEKWTDDNHYTMEWYGPDKTGKEYKMMEIHFTRAK
jgi:hypothetical protein